MFNRSRQCLGEIPEDRSPSKEGWPSKEGAAATVQRISRVIMARSLALFALSARHADHRLRIIRRRCGRVKVALADLVEDHLGAIGPDTEASRSYLAAVVMARHDVLRCAVLLVPVPQCLPACPHATGW